MAKYFFYKLTVDNGGAPCVSGKQLSLAICKPVIRSCAEEGDVVFGFAGNSLHSDNRLIYIAKVTKKLRGEVYYRDAAYSRRGDCIYRWDGHAFSVRAGAQFHGAPDDLRHDLGKSPYFHRANVLLSDDFRYFGGSLPEHYKKRFPNLARAVEKLGRGHRVHHELALVSELEKLKAETWRNATKQSAGSPSQSPKCGISHRGGGCGLIEKC